MKSKYIIAGVFVIVALVQLSVPFSMIFEKEKIIEEGETYLFNTEPIDPSDPFRGKYVTLRFRDRQLKKDTIIKENWTRGETVYVILEQDSAGFAIPTDVSKTIPEGNNFVKAEIARVSSYRFYFRYPFNRFYMNEYKAKAAEEAYFESRRSDSLQAYASVKLNRGEAVLENVFIDGIGLKEVAEGKLLEELEEKEELE